ncbi:phenylacetate--CoA ligase family protein [Vibrio sp. 16]|uniref:phenylacetate--CoA ligase family protein n=1 Tax=Vibrio sp. 16 TaxID=391586 RepID=UPI00018F2237|nr:phenylacetate--CoA ligase family protein [Vibrio sp. 16]EED28043.1 putative CapK protein [Vibrio sp. 16]CAK4075157.1 hypothetical protein VDT1_3830 [Vibrio sp. 16]
MYSSKLYLISPIIAQTLYINVKSLIYKFIRENFLYRKRLTELMRNCSASRKEILEIQARSTESILREASLGTQAYRDGGTDINHYKVTTKDDVANGLEKYVNNRKKLSFSFKSSTGGTTGKPLSLLSNLTAIIEDHAQSHRQLVWAGFEPGDRRVWLRADMIVPLSQKTAPYGRINLVDNMLMLSAYHINSETVSDYVSELNVYNPKIIQAYPSAIYLLAKLIDESGADLKISLKSIVLSSESYSIEQKALIERVFRCPVFSWYGLSERVSTVGTCREGKLHLIEDYGLHEFDENGVLIATGFHNSKMPLIRYNTGDRFSGVENEFTLCGCGLPFRRVDRIEGRVGEYLISDTGDRVSIFNHIPKGVIGLIELQLVQRKHKKIDAIVVISDAFNSNSISKLISNVQRYLGPQTEVNVVLTDEIARTRSGKFRQAICYIEEN